MKKVIFIFTLALGLMSFTESRTSKTLKDQRSENLEKEICSRTCRYAVNRETGSRRLLGCTDWDCGSLPEVTLIISQ